MRAVVSAALALTVLATVATPSNGDIYMHNPRGSNNRNCRNSNAKARANGNRLFDSQNNDNGGYSCPRAYPFDCYTLDDAAERATCNAKNTGLSDADAKAAVRSDGRLIHPDAVDTPRMYYHAGSVLPVEWTDQHGSGGNGKVHSDIVLQVACEGSEGDATGTFSFTDDCGSAAAPQSCGPRDGTPINNQDGTNTQTIPEAVGAQDDYRYGRHESYRFYKFCRNLERNKGLFTADQDLNGNENDARFTRQNAAGTRFGLECPEESEYYPWWKPSPWIDVAVLTSDMGKCQRDVAESQNVKSKSFCECDAQACQGDGKLPNNERACVEKGGVWRAHPAWNSVFGGVTEPECIQGSFSRDNHLGNVGGNGQNYFYNWTLPTYLAGKSQCVLRVRYNISTADFGHLSVVGDSIFNDDASPLRDRNESPEDVFVGISNLCSTPNCKLGYAVNSNQYGRTFQDRSYAFGIKPAPADADCDAIYNLNVRGKRGNIVQTYPAVEYDFVPNKLVMSEDDCLHVQWTGSDYNPNRNPNDAEGGPPNPNNVNEGKSDRSNLVQMGTERDNRAILDANSFNMFDVGVDVVKRLAFLDQDVEDPETCLSYTGLEARNGNNDARDRDHHNCMKLSGQKTPYFNAGVLKSKEGTYEYMSTRNNNFSNRGQKGILQVLSGGLSAGAIAGIVIGTLIGVAGLVAAAFFFVLPAYRKHKANSAMSPTTLNVAVAAPVVASTSPMAHGVAPTPGAIVCVASYDHAANEPGELGFKAGDRITVLKKDASGWWEGRASNGQVGVFPSNFCVVQDASVDAYAASKV